MAITNIPEGIQQYQKLNDTSAQKPQLPSANPELDEKLAQYGVSSTYTKVEYQASVVSHLFGDQDQAVENSLKMTFQAAITKLNEILGPELGEEAPISQEKLEEQGGMEYWSPESTAKRIVDGASGFLEGFKKAHPELEGEALMNKFDDIVGGGLRQGFEEAQSILEDLKVFDGLVKENFDSTFNLVNQGMLDFRNQYLGITPELDQTAPITTEETQNA